MKNTLVIVADLAHFKVFRYERAGNGSHARLELLEQFSDSETRRKMVDQVSDLAGRFPRATVAPDIMGGMSQGERHNIELEKRRRSVRRIVGRIDSVLRGHDSAHCLLAASREIHRQLLDQLPPPLRLRIDRIVPADLTRVDKAEVLAQVEKAFSA